MKKRLLSLALAAVMALSLSISAFAVGDTYVSDSVYLTVNGHEYQIWSELYTGTKNRSSVWIKETGLVDMPAGTLGAVACLYNSSGALTQRKMTYSTTKAYFHYDATQGVASESAVYGSGEVAVYNGSKYITCEAPETVRVLDRAASPLALTSSYPVNSLGHTYGSQLSSKLAGGRPDLIYAEGLYGALGYVKAEDLYPEINDPDQALAYMASLVHTSWIPLYDQEEHVIGLFELSHSDSEETEAAQASPLELVPAVTEDGTHGYLLRNYKTPSITCPEEALEYMRVTEDISYFVKPLYDRQGNVIGQFPWDSSKTTLSSAEISAALNR